MNLGREPHQSTHHRCSAKRPSSSTRYSREHSLLAWRLANQWPTKWILPRDHTKAENPQSIVRCGFSSGDADRARTDDLLRDRHFHQIYAAVRICAPACADVAFMRGCPDFFVCQVCAYVRRRGRDLVSNLVSEKSRMQRSLQLRRRFFEGVTLKVDDSPISELNTRLGQ